MGFRVWGLGAYGLGLMSLASEPWVQEPLDDLVPRSALYILANRFLTLQSFCQPFKYLRPSSFESRNHKFTVVAVVNSYATLHIRRPHHGKHGKLLGPRQTVTLNE